MEPHIKKKTIRYQQGDTYNEFEQRFNSKGQLCYVKINNEELDQEKIKDYVDPTYNDDPDIEYNQYDDKMYLIYNTYYNKEGYLVEQMYEYYD